MSTTERLHFHFSLSCIGEGNGSPLQCSCLENPRDGEAWWAAVYGVTQSRTRLKRLSSSSSSSNRTRRGQFSFQSQRKATPKNAAVISCTSKAMLKSLQARLQKYVNSELPDVQAEFRKGRGTRDQSANICWIIKKQESTRKTSISALLTMPKPLTVWITTNCGNS